MALDIVLLIIRITVALILYVFLGTILLYVLKDIQTTSQHLDESQRVSGRLIVIEYKDIINENGLAYPLKRLTTLGRGPTNTIVLQDSFASIYHARIMYRSGQWWIEDQHSHNGTLLNDISLTEAVVLSSGDIIGIGRTKLLVELN